MHLLHVLLLPVAMALSWAWAVIRLTGRIDGAGLAVLGGGVLVVYGGDRLRDPGGVLTALWRRRPWQRRLVQGAVLLGGAILGLGLWWAWWPALTSLVCAAVLLVLLIPARRLPGGKEVVVGISWAVLCTSLPTGLTPWLAIQMLPAWIGLQALLFTAGTALCDLKDREQDQARGRRSLATLDDGSAAQRIAMALALGALFLAWPLPGNGIAVSASAVLVLAQVPRLLRRPLLGPALVDAALCLVLIDVG